MTSKYFNPNIRALPEENRLVRQAKSGDANAFVQLYDAYGDDVYRYVYFRVINDVAAEGITSHVFRYAWENLDSYQKNGSSFVTWIYKIARNQVIDYYQGNVKSRSFDLGFLSAAVDYRFIKEGQDLFNLEAWRNHLRLLTADTQHTLLQMRTLQTVARYLDYLNPGRDVKPSPTFNAYTRSWLTRYLQSHARLPQKSSSSWRTSLAFAVLIAALLVTGTARSQSALPGDILYGWKRTSEQAWRSLSPDPVGTEIILANRRLNEWIAVERDPARSAKASTDYFDALALLKPIGDAQARARIIPVLNAHRERLGNAGLSTTQFDNYLTVGVVPSLGVVPTQVSLTEVVPPATESSVIAAPPATQVHIEIAPPATEVPTEVVPPATEVPTEVVQPATAVPTEVAPPATEVPIEVVPPATEAPTEVINPVSPTEIPQTIPTEVIP